MIILAIISRLGAKSYWKILLITNWQTTKVKEILIMAVMRKILLALYHQLFLEELLLKKKSSSMYLVNFHLGKLKNLLMKYVGVHIGKAGLNTGQRFGMTGNFMLIRVK